MTSLQWRQKRGAKQVKSEAVVEDQELFSADIESACLQTPWPKETVGAHFLLLDDDSRGVAKRVSPTAALLAAAAAGTSVLRWLATRAAG